jgi:hypothetical protein
MNLKILGCVCGRLHTTATGMRLEGDAPLAVPAPSSVLERAGE